MYEAQFSYVWKVLCRLGVPPADVEDLAHDVFAAAYQQFHQFDRTRPIRPWLFGFCFRRALDNKRRSRTKLEHSSDTVEAVCEGKSAEELVAEGQGWKLAQRALDGIEVERRAIFILHDLDGVSVPEIAESLGVPLNTAYSRLRLARRDFNTQVATLMQGKRSES